MVMKMNKRIIVNETGFGEMISSIREQMNLPQNEMAKKCFVHKNTIANWENGYTVPSLDVFITAVKGLGYHLEMVKDENARSKS